jgi:Family of unknown function (DUF5631)/Family of unknown function (DUF5632)
MARQRLRRATRESLEIPAFSSHIDCTPWVTGGLWPAELSMITDETAPLADYLRADLQRITRSANDELKVIKRAGLTESAREAEEARIIDEARAHAARRVESTIRHVRTMKAQMLAGHRRPQVTERFARRDLHETQVIPVVTDVEAPVAVPTDAAAKPQESTEGDPPETSVAPPAPAVPVTDDDDESGDSAARHRAPDDDDAVTTVITPVSETPEKPEVPETVEATEAPHAPDLVDAPVDAPETAAVPETVEAPETSQPPEMVDFPQAVKASPAVDDPEMAGAAEAVEVPEEPQAPDLVEVPEEPQAVEASEAVDAIETPEAPETVEIPVVAESENERLQRLLAFVVHQEPQLNWAVSDHADGTTLLVTDLAHGWIPSGITLPAGVRLLEPGRRAGKVSALVGESTRIATYTPGDFIGRPADFAATESSVQPRELPAIDDLGWELGRATHWRDGLPRLVHTLAKAAAAGTGVVEEEVDLLRVHLDTARYQLLMQHPDVVPALLLNCLLLAATESVVSGDLISANYHLAWFQKLDEPPASQWTMRP